MYILKENIVVDLKCETQRKVAEKIGITEQTLSKILNRKMACSKMIAYCIVKINNSEAEIEDYFEIIKKGE